MASATDIITYIGVPLAVLGVLPILYTFTLAIITQRRIRSSLIHHGHKPARGKAVRQDEGFTIRSSPMTSLIEIELPRYTIAPLLRNNEDYWKVTGEGFPINEEHHRLLAPTRAETTLSMIEQGRVRGFLRGGSWRTFHWKKLIVGKKLYRIQYEDELREPPAEIEFSELIHFLLDWGAVPDSMGWEKLRAGGLWTPAGTILLRKPEDENSDYKRPVEWVLRTSVPDESDGVLSLSVKWNKFGDDVTTVRGVASLPPGWGRLKQPAVTTPPESDEESSKHSRKDLSARIDELRASNKATIGSTSFRFRVEGNLVGRLQWEAGDIETGFISEPFRRHEQSSLGRWFTYAAAALLSHRSSSPSSGSASFSSIGLWGFELPAPVVTFARADTVPCGLLVILQLLDPINAPEWDSTSGTPLFRGFNAVGTYPQHMRFQERLQAERLEAAMPPEQAKIARANRLARQIQENHSDFMKEIAAREEKEERRVRDAISSPKMSSKAVAQACLASLIQHGEVDKECSVADVAEAVLYLMAVDQEDKRSGDGQVQSETAKIVAVLDEWIAWNQAGGMKMQQVRFLADRKVEFCFAACLVSVIAEAALGSNAQAQGDMLECLNVWRKVRLG